MFERDMVSHIEDNAGAVCSCCPAREPLDRFLGGAGDAADYLLGKGWRASESRVLCPGCYRSGEEVE